MAKPDGVIVILIFYGDAVSLCRRAQLPPPADAGYSFFHKEGDGGENRRETTPPAGADTFIESCTLHFEN